MKIQSMTDNRGMKRSFFVYNMVLFVVMSVAVSAFSGSTWYEDSVIIYSNPDPLRYGIASDTTQERLRDLYDFGMGLSQEIMHYEESGFLTATLMDNSTFMMLEEIFQEVPTAKASHRSLQLAGYYKAITLGEHELYRITQRQHYSEFQHQITSILERPHYLYYNTNSGVLIEFSLEKMPLDMQLLLRNDMTEYLAMMSNEVTEEKVKAIGLLDRLREAYQAYDEGYVIRIHRANSFQNQGYSELEDIMFAATLIGAEKQYWQGVPVGNDYLALVLTTLREDPRMAIYLNQAIK